MKSDFRLVHTFYAFLIVDSICAGCGDGVCPSPMWISFRSGCYTVLPTTLTNSFGIDKARELCKVSGADIVSINNEEENQFITDAFKNQWKGQKEVFLGLFFDTDEKAFKWFDNSEVTFTNWNEDDISEELMNTCAALHTQSGQWRKMSCENFTEMVTLCKATPYSQEKKTAVGENVLITSLVIVVSMLVSIASIVLWVQCKRSNLPPRLPATSCRSANVVPFTDESVLVDAEEREFSA
ncbi:CD302 antigen [Ambystoma mexicanum]|uniref:CD302 antigen n=1 Tax=Ambystoma mexicanum TaxID=8296 RepID=UPI0037E8031A